MQILRERALERSDVTRRVSGRVSRTVRSAIINGAAGLLLGACSLDGILKSDELPPDVTDPAIFQTPAGALAAYNGALAQLRHVLSDNTFLAVAGLLSDELQPAFIGTPNIDAPDDARTLPEGTTTLDRLSDTYSRLHKMRGRASQAIGLLTRYSPDSRPLVGHLYAIQGYAEVLLAELFCSGIPLSTLDFDGDFTYQPGSTTQQVYEHAVALFDTAITLAADSVRFVNLARVGRARALLGLGDLARAATAVAEVPAGYRYSVSFNSADGVNAINFARISPGRLWDFTVSDIEGINGLDYITSGDPRTAVTDRGTNTFGFTIYHPNKYTIDGATSIVLADWVEVRLIEAEAALKAGDGSWLATLNALRTTGTFSTTPPDTAGRVDTVWHAGAGGIEGLRPLADPGSAEERVNLLFRERAFWLFLTGHRQGDLRRLVRQYGRDPQAVYPTGPYPGGFTYGSDVTIPIPTEAELPNPRFSGCLSRRA